MQLAELKPLLAALLLPPAGPILLAGCGVLLSLRFRRSGAGLALGGLAALWLLSCNAVALGLTHRLLPQVDRISAPQLDAVQAVVVLGGGVLPLAAEYGMAPQPSANTAARTRYGVDLAKRSRKPLGFSGGVGWSALGAASVTEAAAARTIAQQLGMRIRWSDDRAHDTEENAARMAQLLLRDGVQRIALVTDPWHMPRATRAFAQVGFEVTPAPTAVPLRQERRMLEWLPSSHGLAISRQALREWLALRWMKA
ncbi:YdcF family protein [Caenimonas sedimenti]|uniref:YdcF family protein n=1 Tax=Caenimonas sedimenti TaxID=2596921 RepID=A0A562ZXC5_9BURK|nr:YdcF family protein [Caenimonas sedimenti]TWO73046.1 YdcF family protein [Caenimonas sedimenti]